MYSTCPKCRRDLPAETADSAKQCPWCGVLFEKWLHANLRPDEMPVSNPASPPKWIAAARERVLFVPPDVDPPTFWFRVALLVTLVVWGASFALMDYARLHGGLPEINQSFMHRVNLAFHEAGHILFIPFGRFMSVLGGSLMQLLVPLVAVWAFLYRTRDTFAAGVGLWWVAQSALDLAPYIYDARRGQMILLGGVTGRDRPGYHDWHNILGDLGLLRQDHLLAGAAHAIGTLVMLTAVTWSGWILFKQFQLLRR